MTFIKYYVVFILCFYTAFGISQEFGISFGTLYSPNVNVQSTSTRTTLSYWPLDDNSTIRVSGISTSQIENQYNAGFNYYVRGQVRHMLSDNLMIEGRIGLVYEQFNMSFQSFQNTNFVELSRDTVASSTTIISFNMPCTQFSNSSDDVRTDFSGTDFSILNLRVGFSGTYALIKDRVNIGMGVDIGTPLSSSEYREYVTINREETSDEVICSFALIEDDNPTGDGLNNLKLNIDAYLEYRLTHNIAVQAGVHKQMSNTFTSYSHPLSTINQNTDSYKPYQFQLGLSYWFGKKTIIQAD